MQKTYNYLRDPAIGLKIAKNPQEMFPKLHGDTSDVFKKLYATALCLKSNPYMPRAAVVTEILKLYYPDHAAANYYEQFPSAIIEIHGYFDDFVQSYLPRNLGQLFSSEGIMTNVEDPADLIIGIFFPNAIRGNGAAASPSGLEEIRSWIALRTWFCAVRWIAERDILQRGRDHMQRITAAFEDDIFASFEGARIRDMHFHYDPHKFVFRQILKSPGKATVTLPLSSRRIGIKGSPLEVFFQSRVKSPFSIWRKISASRKMSDHLAEMLIFLTENDYKRAAPLLNKTLLLSDKVRQKVENGIRIDGTSNPNAFGYKGVYWSGTINTGEVQSELECSSIDRYFDSVAGLTMFNHLVYEVRRLVRPAGNGVPCLWEMLFPPSIYSPLTVELKIRMILRKLASVAEDFYHHDKDRANARVEHIGKLLRAHPEGIDNPHLIKNLARE